MSLLPFFLFLVVLLYLIFSPLLGMLTSRKIPRPKINKKQRLEENKVTNVVSIQDIEELGKEKVAFCRCWKSSKVNGK